MQWFKDRPWFADAMKGFALDDKARTQAELDESFRLVLPMYFANFDAAPDRYRAALGRSQLSFAVYKRRPKAVYDMRGKLARITAPTLVIAGKQDFICGVVPSTWIADEIPGAKLVVLDNVGHMAHLEDSAAFIGAIREFNAAAASRARR